MNDPIFDQLGATLTEVKETSDFFEYHLTIETDRCPHCQSSTRKGHGNSALQRTIADTPARGKKSRIRITRKRYRCNDCGATYMGELQNANMGLGMTDRLIELINCDAPKKPIATIAKEYGVSVVKASEVVGALIALLQERHRFATPEALGIDDLRLRRKLYTVLTDGASGEALTILPSGKAADIAAWIAKNLEREKVRFVVSDLAAVNIAAIKLAWPDNPRSPKYVAGGHRPVHVADKFHAIKAGQAALTSVVSRELDRLRKGGGEMAGAAEVLRRIQPYLLKAVPAPAAHNDNQPSDIAPAQLTFAFAKTAQGSDSVREDVDRFLAGNAVVSRAFWAKMRLHRLYNAADLTSAKAHADSFVRQCQAPEIATAFKAVLNQFLTHQDRILNYYAASQVLPCGKRVGLTNNPTERRNGHIRRAWKSSRGISNLRYLWLRACYEPVNMRELLRTL